MSIYGIRPTNAGNIGGVQPGKAQQLPSTPDARIDQRQVPAGAPAPRNVNAPNAPSNANAALPTQPPPGTDPELWSVLSADERVFFAKLGAMGPLTYGRVLTQAQQPAVPGARGGRLDVKV